MPSIVEDTHPSISSSALQDLGLEDNGLTGPVISRLIATAHWERSAAKEGEEVQPLILRLHRNKARATCRLAPFQTIER